MSGRTLLLRRLAGAAGAAAAAAAVRGGLERTVRAGRLGGRVAWGRVNHRGEPVSLLQGPAYALTATTGAALLPVLPARTRAAAALAVGAGGVAGAYDDLAGSGADRGLRGHLAAVRRGEVTTGAVKVVALATSGLLAGALLTGHRGTGAGRVLDTLLAGGVVAGSANLVNLLDLRPGRATKAAVLLSLPALLRTGPAGDLLAVTSGAALGLLPADLGERTMLGDAGANALGAALGTGLVLTQPRAGLAAHLAAIVALTLVSERVSFTRVIDATPVLRELDALGRRPAT